ncbi:MAG TPA: transglutaminase-like cysteine peptidase [Immundisolibacter sp.]|nr:transglutaminase-like cysteine peptidase [Immundisolibacter sp.]
MQSLLSHIRRAAAAAGRSAHRSTGRRRRRAGFGLLLAVLLLPANAVGPAFDTDALHAIERRYGPAAARRVQDWRQLIDTTRDRPLPARLQAVNDFFNQLLFVDDIIHWKKSDYWATPVEFLATEGGDCEDFAIAKYFTLLELGVPESRLQITYVKALRLNQAHMVLAYYANPAADPLVLDNLLPDVLPGSSRDDLVPVYSFNGQGLWISRARGRGKRVGGSERLSLWQDLITRMEAPASAPTRETVR